MNCRSLHLGPVCLAALLWCAVSGRAQKPCAPPPDLSLADHSANGAGTLGNWYSAHAQGACAIQAYRHGLALDPKSAPLHYSLAVALVAEHQEQPAIGELQQVIELDPRFGRAYLVLGVLAHNNGDRDRALRYWQQATEIDPQSTVALDWIAKTRIESGQYTAVADLVRTAPPSEDLALDLLMADSKAQLYEEAITASQRSLLQHPDWKRLRIALATVLIQHNQFQDGLHLLDVALRDDPQSLDLQTLKLRALVLMNDTDSAMPFATDLLKAHPHDFDMLYLNGLLKRLGGDYEAALPLLEEAEAERPDHGDVRFNLGVVLAKLHRWPEAKRELTRAAALPGSSADVHFQLATVERNLHDMASAAEEMKLYQQRLATQAAHDELISFSAQASQKLQAGDPASAVALEKQILARFPNDAIHWYDLALALDRLQQLEAETAALQRAVSLRPDFAPALNQLGFLQVKAGDSAGAEASFRAAIHSAPQYAEAESNLGSLLSEMGRDAEAEVHLRAALAANPRAVEAWINLGASLAARGQMSGAKQAVQKALILDPQNADAKRLCLMLAQAPVGRD